VVLRQIVEAAATNGARLAEPGEFTLRAFLSGRVDLVQAEAIADLVAAVTPRQARAAFDQLEGTLTRAIGEVDGRLFDVAARLEASLDFPEEGYHFLDGNSVAAVLRQVHDRVEELARAGRSGRVIREGGQVVIVGRPNAGKSSIFNALSGTDRAIVTAVPGTTRDVVSEVVDVLGCPITLVDTAGIHATADVVEEEGVRRARGAAAVADLLLVVVDSSDVTDADRVLMEEMRTRPALLVLSKADLKPSPSLEILGYDQGHVLRVSALTSEGMDPLRRRIVAELGGTDRDRDTAAVTNLRHVRLLERASAALNRAIESATSAAPEEIVLADVHSARENLEEITGRRTSEDLLAHIFASFCVGK
jgi:tRNA modification GTPase